MKSSGAYVLVLFTFLGLAMWTAFGGQQGGSSEADSAGAFRDGLYYGSLAGKRGSRAHLSSARWSQEQDRRAFIAGYMRGYAANGGSVAVIAQAEKAGYRDGMQDGALDRDSGQPFHVLGKLRSQPAEARAQSAYRDAYTSGYQLAYYGNQDGADALIIWPTQPLN